jgi:hypothetical protein
MLVLQLQEKRAMEMVNAMIPAGRRKQAVLF